MNLRTGEGVKKSENFADVIYGSPLCSKIPLPPLVIELAQSRGRETKRIEDHFVERERIEPFEKSKSCHSESSLSRTKAFMLRNAIRGEYNSL